MTIKTDKYILGVSATDTNNFLLDTDLAGALRVRRKSDGSGGTVLTIDANGVVAMPSSVVAASAYQSTGQSIPNVTWTKVSLAAEDFDTLGYFDSTTNYRFQPLIGGFYQVSGSLLFGTSCAVIICAIFKNGTEFKRGVQSGTTGSSGWGSAVSSLVYLNGSSDYLELYGYHSLGSANVTSGGTTGTYFSAILIQKA